MVDSWIDCAINLKSGVICEASRATDYIDRTRRKAVQRMCRHSGTSFKMSQVLWCAISKDRVLVRLKLGNFALKSQDGHSQSCRIIVGSPRFAGNSSRSDRTCMIA